MESFKVWFNESIEEIDKIVKNTNMTAKIPMGDKPIFDVLPTFVRGFHLNTIISRMFQHWKKPAPKFDYDNENPYKYVDRIQSADDKFPKFVPNVKYWAAYKIWKDYIANAVASISASYGKDIHTGNKIDMLTPARQSLPEGESKHHPVKMLKNAWKIVDAVFGKNNIQNKARDYANFFEILHDEYDPDPLYKEAEKDFWEIARGTRETAAEDIEDFVKSNVKTVKGPQSKNLD